MDETVSSLNHQISYEFSWMFVFYCSHMLNVSVNVTKRL